jgi:hypothetical protein
MALSGLNSSAGKSQPNDPTSQHNSTSGWRLGSIFINSITKDVFICVDDRPGNGQWARLVTDRKVGEFNVLPQGEPMSLEGL